MDVQTKGLFENEVLKLRDKYGFNEIVKKKNFSAPFLLIGQYANLISLVLLMAVLFSLFVAEYVDAGFILAVLIGNGIFGFLQEYRAEKTLEKLNTLVLPTARVLRDSQIKEIEAREIVPNDIVVLVEGDRIPADGVLITKVSLEVDESILTGESLPVIKKRQDTLFSGAYIVGGRGYMEVAKIGMDTKLGEIASALEKVQKPKVPLSENLSKLAKSITLIAGILSLSLIPIGILQGRELKELAIVAASLAVAIIPEGLPLVVTIALAVGAYRMVKRRTIVRKIASIETLGSTNVILTDKTGTITQNKMSVKTHWLLNEKNEDLLLRASILGNTASLAFKEDGGFDILGDKTDGALLLFAREKRKNFEEFKIAGEVVEEKPFDADTKTIEIVWKNNGQEYVFIRGAPEKILELIDDKEKEEINKKVNEYAKKALRVIGCGYKKKGDKKFHFLGLVGIYDPPRKEAREAIEKAREAGIKVVMITGDNPVTALSIAQETGLIEKGELVLTSDDIGKLSDEELSKKLSEVSVFARMLPHDKLRLVRLYKNAGYVVAVTGDGVNDALALSQSHIGIAMGATGTDVAKEASDIVITDDNLYTIIHAIEEGRGIFDNIVKVVIFLLSSNFAEFFIIVFGILLNLPIALSATQILWVNLVSDGFPALALATDANRPGLLRNKPRDITEQILSFSRLKTILKITIPFSVLLAVTYLFSLSVYSEEVARLVVFNVLVVGEMIIVFIVRGGIMPINKSLILSVIVSLILQIAINVSPLLRGIFI